jgi:hypothetical protein
MPAPNRGPRLELERGSHFAPCCERERTLPIGRAPGLAPPPIAYSSG